MSLYEDTLKGLAGVISSGAQPKTQAYDTPATVRRVEDGVAYVHIEGGIDETPVNLTIDAKPGDVVMVRVSGGRAWIMGNGSSPPTDDTVAVEAKDKAEETARTLKSVAEVANKAKDTAEEGKAIATATDQYFWSDTNGAHVALTPKDTDPNGATGFNSLWNMLGLLLRNGGNILAQFGQNGIAFYDGSGNETANVLANFGTSGMRIGKAGQTNIQIAPSSVTMTAPNGSVALKALFELYSVQGGGHEYGVRITDENNMSTITIIPALNSDHTDFSNLLQYIANMESFTWHASGSSLQLGDDGLIVEVGNNIVTVGSDGKVKVNSNPPICYTDVTVTVSFSAGTIGTRGAAVACGTTIKSGYTFITAVVLDHQNTTRFKADIAGNDSSHSINLVAYRVTAADVSNASVTVRKIWVRDEIIKWAT